MSLFDQMLNRYVIKTDDEKRNAIHEVMQEITLAGLYRGGFFDKAAFYGGTCLRIFHSMHRFSEDMDFSLVSVHEPFNLEDYFPSVVSEFKASGRLVEITKKTKTGNAKIESAFLKDNPEIYNITFSTERNVKIKIEVDTNPPMNFTTEQKLLLQPFSFMTRCFTLPDMFAGKMHAMLFRNWKTRVKGRDWYDFEWYVRNGVKLNFSHLHERIKQLSGLTVDQAEFYALLKKRLSTTDIEQVKRDVAPFIKDRKTLDIWSNDYFLRLVEKIEFLQG